MSSRTFSNVVPESFDKRLRIEARRDEISISASQILSEEALRQVEQIVDGVFAGDRLRQHRVVVVAGVDEHKGSSLWLTAGVASALTARTGETVHVLSVQGEGSDGSVVQIDPKGAMAKDCIVECDSEFMLRRDTTGRSHLSARVADLRSAGRVVLIHVPNLQRQSNLLGGLDRVDGVVLLIRAAQTRKAVLRSVSDMLAKSHLPVLGAVLLDRVYPVPEKLYRML
jgi:hypothetical protein